MKKKLVNILGIALLTSPMLLLAGGFEIAAWFFDDKASLLSRNGVVTHAKIVDATKDRLGEALHANIEHKLDVSPGKRSNVMHWAIHYEFVSNSGASVKGSYNVQAYDEPVVGREIEVRYLPSDPSVHELTAGHTESQTSALHWIALAFVFIWLATVFVTTAKALVPRRQTAREKRIARQMALNSDAEV